MAATDPISRSSRPRRYTLMIAPLVIGTVALYHGVVSPHVGYLQAMQRLEPVLSRAVEEVDRVSRVRDEKRTELRALQGALAESRKELFTPDESRLFIHDLQELVENAGCAAVALDFTEDHDPAAAPDPNASLAVRSFRLNLTAMGQPEQISALLRSLQTRRPKVWVDSCRLERHRAEAGRLKVHLGLALDAVIPGSNARLSKENDHVRIVQEQEEDGPGEDPDRRR